MTSRPAAITMMAEDACVCKELMMSEELRKWAHIERQFLKEDLKWLTAGAKLLSPSGEDITSAQIERLQARLEHIDVTLSGLSS